MAAGKPIVSFAGSAKVLTHNETGYVVAGNSFHDFAEGVLDLLDRPELMYRMGTKAQTLSRTEYGWETVAEKTLHVYNKTLDQHKE
jgi:glycosyltransferase involved in cell wall biosynthesis